MNEKLKHIELLLLDVDGVMTDGRIIWVLDRGRVVERDADGKPRRMVGSLIDGDND